VGPTSDLAPRAADAPVEQAYVSTSVEPPPLVEGTNGGAAAESGPPEAFEVEWRSTPSVEALKTEFRKPVSAHELAAHLIERHSDYPGRTLVEDLRHAPPDATRKPVAAWEAAIRHLFDPSMTTLHGQLFIVGLALEELDLGERLTRAGVLGQLVDKISELPEAFTESGRRYYGDLPVERDDVVPILGDRPTDADDLGRAIFAEVLADRLQYVRREGAGEQSSFLVHLDGRWGAGKTSLLRLLAQRLREPDAATGRGGWVVIYFNAWQHQRLAPPWWWLMTTVYQQARHELWNLADPRFFLLVLRGLGWRLRDGWMAYALIPVAVVLFVVLWKTAFFGLADFSEKDFFEVLGFFASAAATLTGLALSVWGILRGFNRLLLFGSARGAETVLQRGRDPMELVRRRYASLIRAIRRPVAIVIDDLDRCQPSYVVELLEGIQTLFVEEPVTYVVAADKHWLSDSYATVYKDFVSNADQVGRPLGYLFLEKTFQLSVRVPHLSPEVRDRFWLGLLRRTRERAESPRRPDRFWNKLYAMIRRRNAVVRPADPETERAREAGEAAVTHVSSEEEVFKALASVEGDATVEAEELRKAAIRKLKDPRIEARTAHTLEGFAALLEENPRAMKKLINAYGVERDYQLRRGKKISTGTRRRLAFWTTLGLRWPLLTEFLAKRPAAIVWFRDGAATDGIDERTLALFEDPEVKAVIDGQDPSVRLTEASLRYILDLGPGTQD
jgi:hypothetical protein